MRLKRFLLLLLCVLFLASGAQAQGGKLGRWRVKRGAHRTYLPEEKSAVYQKRLEQSFAKAKQYEWLHPFAADAVNSHPFSLLGTPFKRPEQIYPNMTSLLSTPEDWTNYILANHNRRFTSELFQAKQKLRYLEDHLEELYQAQHVPSVPAHQYVDELIKHIPNDVQYILLGESHHPFIRNTVVDLMLEIGEKYKGREIFLLTEFSYENVNEPWDWFPGEGGLLAVYAAARETNMSLVGLEPQFVQEDPGVALTDPGVNETQYFWASPEGIYLRNRHWTQILYQQRKEHPDALFIVYAGAYHLLYGNAHSVGSALPAEKTFNITLLPMDIRYEFSGLSHVSPFDDISQLNGLEVHPFVLFDKPQAQIVGFDARLFLEEPF